ncbi:MAG: hypothetical protein LBV41_03965 [Cytophagaceae bacterium]|jgi:hypothetical protein|nr:hypothetical protein [Cytophagaceae bacterium]
MMKLLTIILYLSGFYFQVFAQPALHKVAAEWEQLQEADDNEKNYRFYSFVEMLSENVFTEKASLPSEWIYTKVPASDLYFAAGILRFTQQPSRMIWLLCTDNETASSVFVKPINLTENEPMKIVADFELLQDGSEAMSLAISVNDKKYVEIQDIEVSIQFSKLSKNHVDSEKEQLCTEIGKRLQRLLKDESLFDNRLTDYERLSTVISPDKKVKLCTWNVESSLSEHHFYGVLAIRTNSKLMVYKLNDERNILKNAAFETLSPDKWYGCIYYDILEHKYKGNTCYTLLGFNGNDAFSQIKVVDILTFSEKENPAPKFGASVFADTYKNNRRIIYEYSKKVTMMLRYDTRERMIVMDNLSPFDLLYQNNFRYYGPDFSYNGFKFEKGKWIYYQDIDLRNPDTNN